MKKLTILLAGVLIFLTGCQTLPTDNGSGESKTTYSSITQEEAKDIMDSEENYIILDVRTKEEYESGHIKNAVLLPNEDISSDTASEVLPDKGQKILIYCRSGNRSKQASKKLVALGYTNIYEFGGIGTWKYGIE